MNRQMKLNWKILAGVVLFALAQMCAFAQTATQPATTTASMLLAAEKPVADAAAHSMAAHSSTAQPATAAQSTTPAKPISRFGKRMKMRNMMTMPTGVSSPAVTPLDPNTVPKFANQLTRPATFVPVGTKFDPSLGQRVPLYQVTMDTVFQQILPPGFPKTKIYAYGGSANVSGPGQQQNIQTVFSTPGPTFEATSNQRIFVHYINDLDGPHMFPVDPTIMAANPNKAPIPPPTTSD